MKISLAQSIEKKEYAEKSDLLKIMKGITDASKVINASVNKAGLLNILGAAGSENIQGESQQKLDVFADQEFIAAMKKCGVVCGVASEENESHLDFELPSEGKNRYVVLFDPLDGSSNIDVNISIGTIFSVFKVKHESTALSRSDFLQKGEDQFAAGYVLYGTSTMLVYSAGQGVDGFTLDVDTGDYFLSHPNMRFPDDGKIYSINEGNFHSLPLGVQNYLDYCKGNKKEGIPALSARYIGSMVADFHRNLIKGGIFLYPATDNAPNGKLRLMYECNPLSYIAEQAQGLGTDGSRPITSILPDELHQRTPIYLGSSKMVKKLLTYIASDKV